MTLGTWGIDDSSYVVAYDDASGAIAARLWWLLRWLGHERVAVLDGGLDSWLASGQPLETSSREWQATRYVPVTIHGDWVVPTEALQQRLDSGALLLDARSSPRFRGVEEPIDPIAGHVPGALNLPFTEVLAEDGHMLGSTVLKEKFATVLEGHPAEDAIAMCGSGVTACHLLLALDAAGLGNGRLYAGSWSEWICDSDREIATGEA